MKSFYFILMQLCLAGLVFGASDLPGQLYRDIQDGRLDDFRLIDAAWIISGVTDNDSLTHNLDWYNNILHEVSAIGFVDPFNKTGSAEKLFYYLHTHYLKNYLEKATTLVDIKERGTFNCVSATVLYNLLGADLGFATEAFETPTHVYTIFTNFSEQVMVENTSSMGFNIMKNLHAYSQYLATFYPENQVLQIGLDRLWAFEQSRGRRINNCELLGLICYNQAFFARQAGNYEKAYDFVLLAQLFNQDSRSNQRFEVNLYYEWGKKLFNSGQYQKAFEVFADGYYRYPDNQDFRQNCLMTFFNTLELMWQQKNWQITLDLIDEIYELEILSDSDLEKVKQLILAWSRFHVVKQDKQSLRAAIELLKVKFVDEKLIDELEKQLQP